MHCLDFRAFALVLLATLPVALNAQDEPTAPPAVPYVSVSIEVNGLAESASMLDDAMRQLSETMSEIAASPEDLTPEQLDAFAALTSETTLLVVALDQTLQGIGPAIRGAEQPSRELLAAWIETARAEAIDPTLASVDRSVRNWLMLTMLGVLLVVGLAGLGIVLAARQLTAVATLLRSIANDYEIVPKQAQASAPAAPAVEASEPGDGGETS